MEGAGEFMEIERMKIEYVEARGDGMEDRSLLEGIPNALLYFKRSITK